MEQDAAKDGYDWKGMLRETDTHEMEHQSVQCEYCHKWIERQELETHLIVECLSKTVLCPNTGAGLEWSGKQTELTTHRQKCSFESIPCPYQCGEVISRQNLECHIGECTERNVECPNENIGCLWSGKIIYLEDHAKVCGYRKIKSPDSCGESIKEDRLSYHLNNACPMRIAGKEQCSDVHQDSSSIRITATVDTRVDSEKHDTPQPSQYSNCGKMTIRHDIENHISDERSRGIVSCTNVSLGCRWMGKQSELPTHTQTCDFNLTQCPNSCGNLIKRCEIATHLSDQCPNRIIPCPNTGAGCEWSGKKTELDTHRKTCSFESIPCPYQCGEVISRPNLEHHMIECPERSVQCPNEKNGCIWMGKLKDINIHKAVCTHHTRMCPKKCGAYFITQEDIEIHNNKGSPKRKVSCDNSSQGCHWKGPRCELAAHKQVCDSRLLQCLDSSSELNQQSDIKDDVTNESTKRAVQNTHKKEGILRIRIPHAVLVEERGTDPVGLRPSDRKYKCDENFYATIVQELNRHVTVPPLLIFLNKESAQGATCVTHMTSARIDLSMVKKCFKDTDLQKSTTVKFKQTTCAKLHKKEEKELALDMQQLVVTKVKKESMDSEQLLFHLESMRDGRKNNRMYLTSKFEISIVKLDPTEIEFFPFPNNFMIQDTTTYLNQTNQQKSLLSWFQACLLQMMTKSQPLVTVNKFVESWTSLFTFGGDKMRKLFTQFTYLMLRSRLELRTSKNGHALGNLFKVWVDFIDLFLHSEDDGGDKVTDELVSLALDYLSDPSEQISIFTSNTSNSTLALKDMKHHFYYGGTNEAVLSLPSSKIISGCQYQHVQQVSVKHLNIMPAIALKKMSMKLLHKV